MTPTVADLATGHDIVALGEEWNGLATRLSDSSYFQSADWVLSWWDTVAGRAPTQVACWREAGGTLIALAAVSTARERLHRRIGVSVPVGALAGTGPGDADHCGPLVPLGMAADVGAWLAAFAGTRTLVLRSIDGDRARWLPPRAAAVERVACPTLRLDGASGVGRVGRSSNFRTQLGRYARRLQRAGVTLEWVAPGKVSAPIIDSLVELHQRRRAERGVHSTLDERHRALLMQCARRAGLRRGPAAVVARKRSETVGVLLGFWWNGCFSAYQSGWDPSFAPLSIGSVLVAHAIEFAAADGAHTIDFLRGREAYKYRFGASDVYDTTYLVRRGSVGAMLGARAALKGRQVRRSADASKSAPSLAAST